MKKLTLSLDALRVETFETASSLPGGGTVAAAVARATDDTQKPDCDLSGAGTCGYSFCGDDTCDTCDYNSYCGESCILVCDAAHVEADLAAIRW